MEISILGLSIRLPGFCCAGEVILLCETVGRRRKTRKLSVETQSNHAGWLTHFGISPGFLELSRDWEGRQRARLLTNMSPTVQVLSCSSEGKTEAW